MRLTQIPLSDLDWAQLDAYADRTFSQRKPWLNYLASIGAGRPIVARLEDRDGEQGWFTGVMGRVAGLPVLVSPRPGWNTAFMGFNLKPGVPRVDALRALARFALTRALYVEVADLAEDTTSPARAGFMCSVGHGYVSDLSLSEDQLLARMSAACRRCIRKAEREGVVVEEASPIGFAEEYHGHLSMVFARQGLRPTYGVERVRALIDAVHPSGDLLLLRAKAPDGSSIATGIFAGYGNCSSFLGNGSVRDMLHLRPNQALHWYAMRYWKTRGVTCHDWGGGGAYKEEYGPAARLYVTQYRTALPMLTQLRQPLLRLLYAVRDRASRVKAARLSAKEPSVGVLPD